MRKIQIEQWGAFEKLCLVTVMHKLRQTIGDQNWAAISRHTKQMYETIGSLLDYDKRNDDWFSIRQCAAQYELMIKGSGTRKKKRTDRHSDQADNFDLLEPLLRQELIEEIKRSLPGLRKEYMRSKCIVEDIDNNRLNEEQLEELILECGDKSMDIKSILKSMLDEKNSESENSPSKPSITPVVQAEPPIQINETKTSSTTSPLLTSLLQSPSPLIRSLPSTSSPTISLLLNSSPPVPITDSTLSKLLETPSIQSTPPSIITALPLPSSSGTQHVPVLKNGEEKTIIIENIDSQKIEEGNIIIEDITGVEQVNEEKTIIIEDVTNVEHEVVESEIIIEQQESPPSKKGLPRRIELEVEDEETEEDVLETVEQIIERVEEAIIETVGESNLSDLDLTQSDDPITIDSDMDEQLDIDQEQTVEVIVLDTTQGMSGSTINEAVIISGSPVKISSDTLVIDDSPVKISSDTVVIDAPVKISSETVVIDDSSMKIDEDTVILDDPSVKINNGTVIIDDPSMIINIDDPSIKINSETVISDEATNTKNEPIISEESTEIVQKGVFSDESAVNNRQVIFNNSINDEEMIIDKSVEVSSNIVLLDDPNKINTERITLDKSSKINEKPTPSVDFTAVKETVDSDDSNEIVTKAIVSDESIESKDKKADFMCDSNVMITKTNGSDEPIEIDAKEIVSDETPMINSTSVVIDDLTEDKNDAVVLQESGVKVSCDTVILNETKNDDLTPIQKIPVEETDEPLDNSDSPTESRGDTFISQSPNKINSEPVQENESPTTTENILINSRDLTTDLDENIVPYSLPKSSDNNEIIVVKSVFDEEKFNNSENIELLDRPVPNENINDSIGVKSPENKGLLQSDSTHSDDLIKDEKVDTTKIDVDSNELKKQSGELFNSNEFSLCKENSNIAPEEKSDTLENTFDNSCIDEEPKDNICDFSNKNNSNSVDLKNILQEKNDENKPVCSDEITVHQKVSLPSALTKHDSDNKHISVKKTKIELKKNVKLKKDTKLKNDVKLKKAIKLKNDVKQKKDTKLKNDFKLKKVTKLDNDIKPKKDTKLKSDVKLKNDVKLKKDIKLKYDDKLRKVSRLKNDIKLKKDTKLKSDIKLKKETELKNDVKLKKNVKVKEDVKPKKDFKGQKASSGTSFTSSKRKPLRKFKKRSLQEIKTDVSSLEKDVISSIDMAIKFLNDLKEQRERVEKKHDKIERQLHEEKILNDVVQYQEETGLPIPVIKEKLERFEVPTSSGFKNKFRWNKGHHADNTKDLSNEAAPSKRAKITRIPETTAITKNFSIKIRPIKYKGKALLEYRRSHPEHFKTLELGRTDKPVKRSSKMSSEDQVIKKFKKSEAIKKPLKQGHNTSIDVAPLIDEDRDQRAWKKSVMLVYSRLASHKYASVFTKPITENDAPGYHDAVLRPMDLSTIKKNIESGIVRTTVEFQRDVILMVQNAIMYNKYDTPYYKMALEMGKDMLSEMEIMVQALGDGVPLGDNEEKQKPRSRLSKSSNDDSTNKRKKHDFDEGTAAKRLRSSSAS